MYTGFWCGDVGVKDHLEGRWVDGRIILRLTFRKGDGGGVHGLD